MSTVQQGPWRVWSDESDDEAGVALIRVLWKKGGCFKVYVVFRWIL